MVIPRTATSLSYCPVCRGISIQFALECVQFEPEFASIGITDIGSKELDEAFAGICSRGEQRWQRYRTLSRI